VVEVYNFESKERRTLRTPAGVPYEPWSQRGQAWIDEHRMSFWDFNSESAYIWDSRDGTVTAQPDVPGPSEFNYTDGGRVLYINHQRDEADIWLLKLRPGSE
jgi:hypothetical protein